jgi:RNA-directed DNA polymerase
MRSVPAGSFERLRALEALWAAWRACRSGKRRRPTIAAFDLDADRHLLALGRDLGSGRYHPGPWRLHLIQDPKPRLIAAPAIPDRILHHALLAEIGPTFEARFIGHSYTVGKGRGPHRAILQFLQWQRRFGFRLHLDIAGYFRNVHHASVRALLFPRLRDPRTRRLLDQILASGELVYRHPLARQIFGDRQPIPGTGLPLGSWFSQWCGTFYLDGLDHFIKRELKIPGYLRYMDDLVLFADERERLREARAGIGDWLARERRLRLNPKHLEVVPNRAPGVFLGYRISRSGIGPSRKLRRRMKTRLRLAAARGETAMVRSIHSYRGLLLFPHGR